MQCWPLKKGSDVKHKCPLLASSLFPTKLLAEGLESNVPPLIVHPEQQILHVFNSILYIYPSPTHLTHVLFSDKKG